MILNTSQEDQTGKKFSKAIKPYLAEFDSRIVSLEKHDRSSRKVVHLGDQVQVPASDITHLFSNQAMLAVRHAIEDLAFQHFDNFKPQKKRYLGLAKDLDAVRVWGSGTPPKRCPRIDFIPIFREELKRYWIVLFSSPSAHAALVCCQVNKSDDFSRKVFAGFYTFNPFVVESVKREFNLMSIGLDRMVKAFDRQLNIPNLSLKEIEEYFQNSGKQVEP